MPGRNGNGPTGAGPMTGRGMGFCTGSARQAGRYGLGSFCRRFFGRGFGLGRGLTANPAPSQTEREELQAQRDALKNRLEALDKELERVTE